MMMRSCLTLCVIAAHALAPVQAAEQVQAQEPSPKALELARLLGPSKLLGMVDMPREYELKQIQDAMYSTTLTWKGPPCDEKSAQCASVAGQIAERILTDRTKHQRDMAEYAYALRFQQTMSDEDMDNGIAFLRTKSGQQFSESMRSAVSPMTIAALMTPGSMLSMKARQWSMTPYLEEFYDRTKGLPRSTRPGPPPPAPSPRRSSRQGQ